MLTFKKCSLGHIFRRVTEHVVQTATRRTIRNRTERDAKEEKMHATRRLIRHAVAGES